MEAWQVIIEGRFTSSDTLFPAGNGCWPIYRVGGAKSRRCRRLRLQLFYHRTRSYRRSRNLVLLEQILLATGFDLRLSTLAGQSDGLVAISLPGDGTGVARNSGVANPPMARAPGRIPLFYRDAIPGTRVLGCLSVPLLACSGPFPVSCVPRDYCAHGTRNSPAAQAPAALASTNWLSAVRSITSLVDCPHLASERDVYRHQNALAHHDRKKSHGLDGP